jgi:hypothetical protein
MRRLIFASLLLLGLGSSIGCDKIISSDVTETSFALPAKSYSFDASMFNVPSSVTQEVPCGDGQIVTDCCAPPQPLPQPDCNANMLTCEQNENGTNVCMAQVTVSQASPINLGMEVPALSSITGVLTIKIKRISYAVTANTLSVDLPDVVLYVAPQGVTDPMDSRAQRFGTLPSIPSMMTPAGDVVLDPNAASALAMFTQNIQAPFTFLAAATLKVSHAPTGKIDVTVSGTLAASL